MSGGFTMPCSHFKVLWWCPMCDGSIQHTWNGRAFLWVQDMQLLCILSCLSSSQSKSYWLNRPRFMAHIWGYKLKPFKLFLPVYWQPLYHQSFPSINPPGGVVLAWLRTSKVTICRKCFMPQLDACKWLYPHTHTEVRRDWCSYNPGIISD